MIDCAYIFKHYSKSKFLFIITRIYIYIQTNIIINFTSHYMNIEPTTQSQANHGSCLIFDKLPLFVKFHKSFSKIFIWIFIYLRIQTNIQRCARRMPKSFVCYIRKFRSDIFMNLRIPYTYIENKL